MNTLATEKAEYNYFEFCPMHKAAPKLIEALEKAIDMITSEYCSHISDTGDCGPNNPKCYAREQYQALKDAGR